MVERLRKQVCGVAFSFMKTLNDELDQEHSFGSGHEACDLACFCVLELFNTELPCPMHQKADSNGTTDLGMQGSCAWESQFSRRLRIF